MELGGISAVYENDAEEAVKKATAISEMMQIAKRVGVEIQLRSDD